ncbi:MipA/OmpV family protein [Massilia sp. TS11]|uniref:MipA/OmpV family protein n=1 Tax=Massilia sp. TS11 TaxID=2908003 RepID=UPI001EDB7C4A|nr:MipA/OmpV family protein [Massilia sp. TS11]MCG2584441.1 MipA/OmpV family protein [Massilia sp. TS11]
MRRLAALTALALPLSAQAGSEVLIDFLAIQNSAGLGGILRSEFPAYKGTTLSHDLVPLYMYEGQRVFLHATRVGVKLTEAPREGMDVFLDYRFEGHPINNTPSALRGMQRREPGMDAGAALHYRPRWGALDLEVLRDASNKSRGVEWRLGYNLDLQSGRWHFRPSVVAARRSAALNDYYYGVRPNEALAGRPAYAAGAGTNISYSLYAYYELTQRWRLLAGLTVDDLSDSIRHSPIVADKAQLSGLLGLAYDFGNHKAYTDPYLPLHLKVFAGKATECNFLPVVTLRCGSLRSQDDTRIAGFAVGRPLIEGVNGWPLDFVAYVGLTGHDERGIQANGLQLDAHIKAYYYGLPWNSRVRTRIGMGAGFSLAQRVPLTEVRDQGRRGRDTARFLNYLDPSLDISVGDLLGRPNMRETYLGVGVSHRSGIFGTSTLLGNINGGSNYLVAYIEAKL